MKLTQLETLALIVAGAGLGAHIVALGPLWKWALFGGLIVALGSWIQHAGWRTP